MIKSKKVISIMLIILLVAGFITPSVYALTGSFNFTSNENSNIQGEDTFIYRNDCFKRKIRQRDCPRIEEAIRN